MNLRHNAEAFLTAIGRDLRPQSISYYRRGMKNILDFAGDRDPNTLTTEDVRNWITWMQTFRRACNRTIRSDMMLWERFLGWLEDQRLVEPDRRDIFIRRKLPKLIVIRQEMHRMAEDEHEALLRAARGGKNKYWWVCACLMGWHLGMRISDVAFSKWSNIDWEEETYNETPLKTRRLGKKISVPMDPELVAYLYALRDRPFYVSEYIIPDAAGYYGDSGRSLTGLFEGLRNAAGLSNEVTFHAYRHGFVSRMLEAGVEPLIIASMTGQTVDQIAEYAHISSVAKHDALAKARQLVHRDRLIRRGVLPRSGYQPAMETALPAAQEQKAH